ncbi:hypothetical protein [Corynebacterium xerosis]|uniref:hypothetical protein n=1 Tax=Corynebacterium xerosis TaxID=1725 RepID=UPI0036706EBD
MAIPKKTPTENTAADALLRSRPKTATGDKKVRARDILPTSPATSSKTKLTLTMNPDLKRQLKAAAAAADTTVSDLVETWATDWLDKNIK